MNYKVTTPEVEKRQQKVSDAQEKRNEKYYTWLRNLITISIALFALIISLKKGESKTKIESLFFIISIISLGLGILSALITLYGEVKVLSLLRNEYQKQVLKYVGGKSEEVDFETVNVPPLYKISSYLYVFFYLVSLVSLVFYSTISEIN
jgi:amino acid permease